MGLDYLSLNSNSQIRAAARESLRGKWGLPLGLCLVINIIAAASGSVGILALLIMGALLLGQSIFFLKWIRDEEPSFDDGFKGFNAFGNSLGLYLLRLLFTILWTLLFIIPGIIKSYAYSQSFFIMADYPEMGPMEALTFSQQMMKGAKAKLFCLHIHFMLLGILCIFTMGIGFLWLSPFVQTASAEFYQDLKANFSRD